MFDFIQDSLALRILFLFSFFLGPSKAKLEERMTTTPVFLPGGESHGQGAWQATVRSHPAISSSVVPFSCPQSLPASVFSNESTLRMRWPKYWSFSFRISPSKEIPGLISFRMDWLDILAVQGTLKSLLQHHSSKASILWCSAFFIKGHYSLPCSDCILGSHTISQ